MSIQDITSLAQCIGACVSAALTTYTFIKAIRERTKLNDKSTKHNVASNSGSSSISSGIDSNNDTVSTKQDNIK